MKIDKVKKEIERLLELYKQHVGKLEKEYPNSHGEISYWNGYLQCMEYFKNFFDSLPDDPITVDGIKEFVDKRTDELWEIIPDSDSVLNEKCTNIDIRNLGIFMGFEEVSNFIEAKYTDDKVETIIAAAYKVKREYVCNQGEVWKTGTKERDDIYQCRIGRHHAEILHCFGNEVDQSTDGFYTSFGRWVDRKEAAQIALKSGQLKKLNYWEDKLDSSDLW